MPTPDYVSRQDIAERFGIPKFTVYSWVRREKFPTPAIQNSRFLFWDWKVIQPVVKALLLDSTPGPKL